MPALSANVMGAMAKRRSGNPARWEPLEIGPAANTGSTIGMAAAFHATGGERHWYGYRTSQRATACLAFVNRLYNGFALVFEDGSMHLTFKRNDRAAVRDWRHFQAIKNEVAGPEREAVEIFPPESQLVDAANEYHLWVLPEGMLAPVGFYDRAVLPGGEFGKGRQREFEEGLPSGPAYGGYTITSEEIAEALKNHPS